MLTLKFVFEKQKNFSVIDKVDGQGEINVNKCFINSIVSRFGCSFER